MKYGFLIIFISYTFCSSISLRAEDKSDSRNPEGLITFGIGSGYFGPSLYFGLSYISNNNLFTIRYWKADEFRFNVEGHYDEPALNCKEIGFLYGRTYQKKYLILSLSAGLAYLDGIDRGTLLSIKQYEQVAISTIGVPFEAKFRFRLGFISLGGSWYGDLNTKRSTSGVLFELSFGIL